MTETCRPSTRSHRSIILDVAKHRNGPTGEVRLNFFFAHTRFDNRIEAVGVGEW